MTRPNRKSEEVKSMPALRADLAVLVEGNAEGAMYSIQDPTSGSTYEFGHEEWFLLQQMDGVTDFAEIARRFKTEFNQDAPVEQIEALVRMVSRWGLFKGSGAQRSNIVDLAEVAPATGDRVATDIAGQAGGRKRGRALDKPRKKWGWKQYTIMAILVLIAIAPYPYDTGGQFVILPQLRQDIYAEIEGAVAEVFYNGGETVTAGAVLARQVSAEEEKNLLTTEAAIREQQARLAELLNSPTPEELKLAQQQLDTARTQAKFARESEERLRPLSKTGDISVEQYEDTRRKAEVSQAEVLEAEANLAKVKAGPHPQEIEAARFDLERLNEQLNYYREQLEMTQLLMPFDGRIVTRNLNFMVGNYLDEGDLFAVVENDQMVIVEVEVPETDIADVEIGAAVKVKVWTYPDRMFDGVVTGIAPVVEQDKYENVVVVTTEVPNPDGLLRSGMTGFAKIDGGAKPVIVAFTRMFVRFFLIEIWSWIP
jgi:multidrug resistance efflux pump